MQTVNITVNEECIYFKQLCLVSTIQQKYNEVSMCWAGRFVIRPQIILCSYF